MDERELIVHYLDRSKRGYSVPEITRDLLLRGIDQALINKVLEDFAQEIEAQNQVIDPHMVKAKKEVEKLERRYQTTTAKLPGNKDGLLKRILRNIGLN